MTVLYFCHNSPQFIGRIFDDSGWNRSLTGGDCCMRSGSSFAFIVTAAVVFGSAYPIPSQELPRSAPAATTAIVFGVGSPNINAERSGTSIGIVVGGTLYLFDAGA